MNVVYKTKKKEAIPELILPKVDGNRSVNLEIKKKFPYSIAILSQTSTFHIISTYITKYLPLLSLVKE